jgi:RNA polymerase sigma-70 factor, ECF subfamily
MQALSLPVALSSDNDRLVARAAAGDERAVNLLYYTHVAQVNRLTLRLTGDEELAQECTQLTFSRAFERLATFRGDALFGTWLHRVAINVTLGEMRKVRRFRRVEQDLDLAAEREAGSREADPMLRTRILRALEALPDKLRAVVLLHDVEGYTHQEIGATLDIACGTSKARLWHARTRLRPLLKQCAREYGLRGDRHDADQP